MGVTPRSRPRRMVGKQESERVMSNTIEDQMAEAARWAEEHEGRVSGGATHAGRAAARRAHEKLSRFGIGPGRPSLTSGAQPGEHSRAMNVRIPAELDDLLRAYVAAHGSVSRSAVVRQALEAFLAPPTGRQELQDVPDDRLGAVVRHLLTHPEDLKDTTETVR